MVKKHSNPYSGGLHMLPSVVQYRRALHQIPEIEDRLPKTTAYVLSILGPLN